MADIVLIQPSAGVIDSMRTAHSLPLGLLSAATLAMEEFDVVLIDTRCEKGWRERLLEALARKPLLSGVTAVTGSQILSARKIASFVKAHSDTPVVWGGVHPTLLPEQTLRDPLVDLVVHGEGEVTLRALARALAEKAPLHTVRGVGYKKDGEVHVNEERPFVDLNALPGLPYSLVSLRDYTFEALGRPTFYIETSRGCPNRCAFCYNSRRGPGWRAMSPERSLRQIDDLLAAYGGDEPVHLVFVDDNYFVDIPRTTAIAQGLLDGGYRLTYQVQGVQVEEIKRLTPADWDLLEESGVTRIDMGIESGSPKIQRLIGKGLVPEDVLALNRSLKGRTIRPWYNFMAGFPEETDDDLRQTLDLVRRLLHDHPEALISPIYNYTPFPGTPLFDRSVATGFRPPASLEAWSRCEWSRTMVPWVDDSTRNYLSALYVLSYFIDRKFRYYKSLLGLQWAAEVLRPIARSLFFSGRKRRYLDGLLAKVSR